VTSEKANRAEHLHRVALHDESDACTTRRADRQSERQKLATKLSSGSPVVYGPNAKAIPNSFRASAPSARNWPVGLHISAACRRTAAELGRAESDRLDLVRRRGCRPNRTAELANGEFHAYRARVETKFCSLRSPVASCPELTRGDC
jgi:hypothetical protein